MVIPNSFQGSRAQVSWAAHRPSRIRLACCRLCDRNKPHSNPNSLRTLQSSAPTIRSWWTKGRGSAAVDAAIAAEVNRIGLRAKNDYDAAELVENKQRDVYLQEKEEAEKLNNKAIEYGIARQEANDSRTLYEDIAKRLKEAGVLQGLHGSNITVVEPGLVPARPATPNIPNLSRHIHFSRLVFRSLRDTGGRGA